ncbi:hypothetical protein [Burkholderia multivorans]|uniref:hypothetical protein n=1 Tax=Burkholderia multivorans TaxID=87883 RepID=UPI0020B26EB6|nr:hypothetical protein [Burkholderia multivorans]
MPAAAWTDEWAHARRCACIGCGSVRARGVAPPAFVEHAARAFQSHVMRGIRQTAVACASAGKFRKLAGAHRATSPLSGAFRPIAALLASFFRASRSLLARFFRASRPLLSRLFAAACLFRPPFSRDSSPFVCASSRFRRPLSPNR